MDILVAPTPQLGEKLKISLDFLFVQLVWRLLNAFGCISVGVVMEGEANFLCTGFEGKLGPVIGDVSVCVCGPV